jgi:hypothetical protein
MRLADGDVLEFTLQRNFGALYITLSRGKAKTVNLIANDLRTVKIERLHGAETLLAVFGPKHDLHQVRLMLRPTVQLDWGPRGMTLSACPNVLSLALETTPSSLSAGR